MLFYVLCMGGWRQYIVTYSSSNNTTYMYIHVHMYMHLCIYIILSACICVHIYTTQLSQDVYMCIGCGGY